MRMIYQSRTNIACIFVVASTLANCSAGSDTCNSASYSSLIGANIAAVTLPADLNMRLVWDNDPVTNDYVAERINVEVDGQGFIRRINCG